jgi:transcriptional regulator with XRE-family HTH domain
VVTASTNRQEIRKVIEASGKTQEQVAEAIDVSPVTLSRWINGHSDPDFAKLDRLANALGLPLRLTFGPDTQKSAPAWAEALADETARKVIAALAPDDLREAAAVLIARLEGLHRLPDDSSPGHGGAASPGELGPPVRGPG